ncbi:alpha/beta hydrolase [Gorillibacterium timonense]|uniref:alpha/beta hydrolase n=1 Tax=Gorillibacterium timonense TaxID=1689269 RepID=UPI0011DE4E86|nr:alpha/beta hydrolase [Gorillibacterium timonense]
MNARLKAKEIPVLSHWDIQLKPKLIAAHEGNNKLVVLFPGKNYSCETPLFYYAGSMALQCDYDVLEMEYGYQVKRVGYNPEDLLKVVEDCFAAIKPIAGSYHRIVFISKSLGTLVAGEVHRLLHLPIHHVYLTPLADTIPYINSSSSFVITGENDVFFGEQELQAIDLTSVSRLIRIPHADHGLETGDVREDLSILNQVVHIYREALQDNSALALGNERGDSE